MLGLESMKTEDQTRVALFAVMALALECVLDGLVYNAEVRAWIFHALAASVAMWALVSSNEWAVRSTGAAGLIAVVNDVIAVRENEMSLRFVTPSVVLFVASAFIVWKTFGFFQSRTPRVKPLPNQVPNQLPNQVPKVFRAGVQEVAGQFGIASGAIASVASIPNLRKAIRDSSQDPAWVPFLLLGGALSTIFSMTTAKWITIDALFGLIKRSYGFSELRAIYGDFGIRYYSQLFYFEWGYLITYGAAGVSLLVAAGVLTKRFSPSGTLRLGVLLFVGLALVNHTGIVVGLNNAKQELLVLIGAWMGTLGLLASAVGIWLVGRR